MTLCLCKELKTLKVEADMGANPLWCHECCANLDVDEFTLSEALKGELLQWGETYGTWIDWETDGVVSGGVAMDEAHNARGAKLTEQVRNELMQYDVVFSPSTFAKRHSEV